MKTLTQILKLVGRLDDSPAPDTARERFRGFLKEHVLDVERLRDFIQECLRSAGDQQYSRAFQDLVNHAGRLLGFEVTFGRYHGASGSVGFDGHWGSPTGFHFVVEVKTSQTYAIKTATLVGYIDRLISERIIPNWGARHGALRHRAPRARCSAA